MKEPNLRPVWAQWVPFRGPQGRMPTEESLRKAKDSYYQLPVLRDVGIDVFGFVSVAQFKETIQEYADRPGIVYWLEGHPAEGGQ